MLLRMRPALGLWMLVLFVPTASMAALKVRWDCYLPNAAVDCVVLENSLSSKIPFLRFVSTRRDADVVVTLKSIPAEDGTRFLFDFMGKRVDGYATEMHTQDKIPNSIDPTTAQVRILTKLERGLGDFMDQKVAAEMSEGRLTLQLIDPVQLPFVGRAEQEGIKWYVAPNIGTYFSDVVGVGVNASGSASVPFNYSGAKWRFQDGVSANYNRQSQPVPATNETASISFFGANTVNVVSRSFTQDNRWSVAVLASAEKNPQANYTFRANTSLGAEFDFIPRQTVNQRNLGVRCAVGPEYERYDDTNVQGLSEQWVGRQFCDVFFNWHYLPVDVGATLGETTLLEDFNYRSFSAGLSVTWRITDNFVVSPWVSLQQINKAINEAAPTNVISSDPRQEIEASMRAAVQQGYTAPFNVQSGLSIRYVFGNGSLNSEDQRWRGVSNLR